MIFSWWVSRRDYNNFTSLKHGILGPDRSHAQGRSAARVANRSHDRPNLSHVACFLAIGMTKHTSSDMFWLKMLARYLKGRARAKVYFEFEDVQELTLYTDSVWCSCCSELKCSGSLRRPRRAGSLSGGIFRKGFHVKHFDVKRQWFQECITSRTIYVHVIDRTDNRELQQYN